MDELVNTAQAIEHLGITGILAFICLVEALVIRKLYAELAACAKASLMLAQGEKVL